MPIQATAADGSVHNFEDGTPDNVIDQVMKQYASSGQPAQVPTSNGSFGGKLANALGHLAVSGPTFLNYLTGGLTGPLDEPEKKVTNKLIQKGIVSPEDVNPTSLGGKVTKGITDTTVGGLPLTAISGGLSSFPGALKNIFGLVTSGAGGVLGGEAGKAVGGAPGEFVGNLLGSGLGAAAPSALEGGVNKLSGIPFNSSITPEVANLRQTNMDNGINPSINQFFPNMKRPIKQAQQINAAAGKTMGISGNNLSRDVIAANDDRMGQGFDAAADRIGNIKLDDPYLTKLSDITDRVKKAGISDADEAMIKRVTDQLDPTNPKNNYSNSSINGTTYQQLTQKNGPISDLMNNTNGTVSHFGTELRGMLDDALDRSAPKEEVDNLRTLRQQYKNSLMFKDAIDDYGNLDPSKLTNSRVSKYYGDFNKGGGGDTGDLIKSLQSLKVPYDAPPGKLFGVPTSLAVGAPLLGAAGAGAAEHLLPEMVANHPLASLGVGAGLTSLLALQRGSKAITNSNWYKNQLIDQALGNTPKYNPLLPFIVSQENNQP